MEESCIVKSLCTSDLVLAISKRKFYGLFYDNLIFTFQNSYQAIMIQLLTKLDCLKEMPLINGMDSFILLIAVELPREWINPSCIFLLEAIVLNECC